MTYSNIEGNFYPSTLKRQPELRLIADDLKQDYKKGLLNASAYLYYLVRALRKNGWKLRIWNVAKFCEKWGMKVRSYYRAKSKLYSQGLLQENTIGGSELWVDDGSSTEETTSGSDYATSGSDYATSGSDYATSGSEAQPKPGHSNSSSPSTPLLQLNYFSLSKDEREKFLEFAMKKVDQLPKRPQLPKKWIDKNHDELWAEYQELEQRKETNEQQRMQSIDKQQETVVDPRIAAALENGEILEISYHDKMFRDTDGWWQKWHEYEEWNAKRSANQPTNEELLRNKRLIAKAMGLPM